MSEEKGMSASDYSQTLLDVAKYFQTESANSAVLSALRDAGRQDKLLNSISIKDVFANTYSGLNHWDNIISGGKIPWYIDEVFKNLSDGKKHTVKSPKNIFYTELETIKKETKTVDGRKEVFICKLLFVHVITILEVYLQDTLFDILKNKTILTKFIGEKSLFSDHKIPLKDVDGFNVEKYVMKMIRIQCIFHDLGKVETYYKKIPIVFPKAPLQKLKEAVKKRHAIVHRNCRSDNGEIFDIKKSDVDALIASADSFVSSIEAHVKKLMPN